ncbi:26.2 kDa heat shock protein mitochondrial [Phtheirospermum japonicum]|uniref:26.2 kDa heat shock protein mitochondrial n=1 Tax=Phtheirospermum japonicum TaxID=374723 RepID=A0A830BLA5_9LAMI|nr:26.2 kDa heat shock protein mitochondrial [Phtheirospermum japonicum]
MATSSLALKHFSSLLLAGYPRLVRPVTLPAPSRFFSSGTLRPVHRVTLLAALRLFSSGYLRPVTQPAASRCFSSDAEASYCDRFYAECEPQPENRPPFVHFEFKVENYGDGLHLRLYMAGVGKENVKLWIEGEELIAEGIRDKNFEHQDDTNTVMRYKMLAPPNEAFNLDAIKAEINNGMLKVFVPRINQAEFFPREGSGPDRRKKFYMFG